MKRRKRSRRKMFTKRDIQLIKAGKMNAFCSTEPNLMLIPKLFAWGRVKI